MVLMHPACLPIDELLKACTIRRSRSGGPGGQHRNRVETAIRITHEPTGLSAGATERRSQEENRKVALERLRIRLALEHRVWPTLRDYRRPEYWNRHVVDSRLKLNPRNHDYPAILADTLDLLDAANADLEAASLFLGITPSQIIKLLRTQPPALHWLNSHPGRAGKPTLR